MRVRVHRLCRLSRFPRQIFAKRAPQVSDRVSDPVVVGKHVARHALSSSVPDSWQNYDVEDDESAKAVAIREEKELFESYGLQVDALYADEDEAVDQAEPDAWDSEMYGELDRHQAAEELPAMKAQRERLEEEINFHVDALKRHQVDAVMEKGWELHHSHSERSVNRYATTNMFAMVLDELYRLEDIGFFSPVPIWVRATFVLDQCFDEFNEQLQERIKRDFTLSDTPVARLKQYEDWALSLEGGFNYDLLNLPPMKGAETTSVVTPEPQRAINGVGDNLDDLLGTLPGVSPAQAQAKEFAQELIPAELAFGTENEQGGDRSPDSTSEEGTAEVDF